MEPCIVPGHRLSFGLRAFPPLEPGMGCLETVDPQLNYTQPLFPYKKPECHGGLVQVTAEMYERIMRSEGVGNPTGRSGYEEVLVSAYPYRDPTREIRAIALKCRSAICWKRDPSPSARYMALLCAGAEELGLHPDYQEYLRQHPVEYTPSWLYRLMRYNIVFNSTLNPKTRILSNFQSWWIRAVYIPTTTPPNAPVPLAKRVNVVVMGLILFPGAILGWLMDTLYYRGEYPQSVRWILNFTDKNKSAIATPAASAPSVQNSRVSVTSQ
jgi:hypothetical protein